MPSRFRTIVVFEGLDTGDKRTINVGALAHRALPITLMGMTTEPEFGGHGLSEVVGRIDTLERVDVSDWVDQATGQTWAQVAGGPVFGWIGEGEFDDRTQAVDVEQLVRDRHLRGVSADLAEVTSELEVIEEDEEGWPIDWVDRVVQANIGAATVCNIPAFRGCTITLLDDTGAELWPLSRSTAENDAASPAEEPTGEPADTDAIAASAWLPAFRIVNDGPGCEPCVAGTDDPSAIVAAGGPVYPPTAWFTDPGLDGPTPLTVTDDGRVYGHLATWGTCHTGYSGQCVTPPRSGTDYALFQLGAVRTAEGDDVAVGHITMGTGHADLRSDLNAAAAHYDNTGTVVVDVAAGDDEHGIWVAGALRPDLTDAQVRTLRSASLSGDWRRRGTGLELVAALAVNSPGFPVPRTRSLAASGVPTALVAAGAQAQPSLTKTRVDETTGVQAAVDAALRPFLPMVRDHHLARLRRAR